MSADLIVCGLGPAGRALAHRAAVHGLTVTAIDPHPWRRWPATYATWADELPDWLPARVVAATVERPLARGTREVGIARAYQVFGTAALQDALDLSRVRVIADRVLDIDRGGRVRLASGRILTARRVVDARGLARDARRAEQTAYGIVLHRDREPAVFMDWSRDNGAGAAEPASFLYTIPLGGDRVLFEETCLAGRPAIGLDELRRRLEHRLRCRGIEFGADAPVERVRFPVEGGRAGDGVFGAAGGLLHPATGYSVGAALAAADAVATGRSLWPVSARLVFALRKAGLRALLALPPHELPAFFDAFFALPPDLQRAYLSGRTDPRGTAAAMTALFRELPWPLRRVLAAAAAGVPAAAATGVPAGQP
ncbi:lycopene cyclase [Nocardia sp. BSTN01]|uniref:lycopene cyclase family protein n=1 Tax=Nocardia sp. BSTN01 TaxID=2783665 RepID=UPI00188E5F30|nr:lycopene cyclase family protein [Nocardia sp. BSTN01]MBF4996175.1 lycopene cyclase [Nocardia sp. BSTN01]